MNTTAPKLHPTSRPAHAAAPSHAPGLAKRHAPPRRTFAGSPLLREESLADYEASLSDGLPAEDAELAVNRAYRQMIPRWHFAMLNDVERNVGFRVAIESTVRPGDAVLDVGTGTGLLAMLAARAGARTVVSCEAVTPIAHVARDIVAANGLSSNVSIIAKRSSDLVVGDDLPELADVLVTETIDCGLLGEGIIPIIRHARNHLLKDGARVVPEGAEVSFALLSSEVIHRNNFAFDAAGLDVSQFNRFSTREHFPVRLTTWDHTLLSSPQPLFDFDFQKGDLAGRTKEISIAVGESGWVHGVVFWFDLDLGGGMRLSNAPGNPQTHWMQAVYCFEEPRYVERGQVVVLDASHDDTSFRFAIRP